MNKRLIKRSILLLGLILVVTIAYDYYIDEQKYDSDPSHLSSYPEIGYYKINPEMILTSLDQGETDIFTPLPGDPNLADPLNDVDFSWTQANFLQIADALSKRVWSERLDLNAWTVYHIIFAKHCHNSGFDNARITYFKAYKVYGWKMYTTRYIEIDPYLSKVGWGGGKTYPQPILHKWNGVDLTKARITADDALRITEENGGEEARLKNENDCRIYLRIPNSQKNNDDRWEVRYIGDYLLEMLIDPYTGEHEIVNKD